MWLLQELWHMAFDIKPTASCSYADVISATRPEAEISQANDVIASTKASNIAVLGRAAPSLYIHGPVEVHV